MGRSSPTPPTIIMPEEVTPQAFQTIIPQRSFKDLAAAMNRTERAYNRAVGERYKAVGTAADLGARFAGDRMQEAASYASSLPKGTADERFQETPREFDVTSNNRGSFDTRPGQRSGSGRPRRGTGAGPTTTRRDPARDAATSRYKDLKKVYKDKVKKAKKDKGSGGKMKITKKPSWAEVKDKTYKPKSFEVQILPKLTEDADAAVIAPKFICSVIDSFTNLQSSEETFIPIA